MSAQTTAGTVTISQSSGVPNAGIGRLATTFTAFTALFLAGQVATRWSATGHAPISNLYEFTAAFGFGIAAAYLAFETYMGNRRFGLLALPIVAGMLAIASTFPNEITPLIPALQNGPLLTIHVSMMMLSYAVLTVSFCGAAVYLIQGGEGRRRFAALPSSEAAGDLAHKAVMVGFPMLGLGIALGAWWANSAWGRYWGWDPKETWAFVSWVVYAAYLHARVTAGWKGRAAAAVALVGYGTMLFNFIGVNIFLTGFHSYAGL
jgi:cytochrome c-type biogenesis protein CcsB